MARPFNPKLVLTHISNQFLSQYFGRKGLLAKINFEKLDEAEVDPIYAAYLKLPEKERREIEKELKEIEHMATEDGNRAIIREADHYEEDLRHILSSLNNLYDRAIWTLLNRPYFWGTALLFYHAFSIPEPYWRRRKNVPENPVLIKPKSIQHLEQEISNYFYRKEARGKNCKIQYYRRGDLDIFFAYPEDYARTNIVWFNNEFKRLPHNPAFEIIFVYTQIKGTLDICYKGTKDPIEDLQKLFAGVILKTELGPAKKDERVYHLNRLKYRDFPFIYDELESGIQDVLVRWLRFSSKHSDDYDQIIFKADPTYNRYAVYDLIDKEIKPSSRLSEYNVTQVRLTVIFGPEAGASRQKSRTFNISWPNSCNLKQEGRDLIIRQMLADSSLEPMEKMEPENPLFEYDADLDVPHTLTIA